MSLDDNILILISENFPLLIEIIEYTIFPDYHDYKYSAANQWIIQWFRFRERMRQIETIKLVRNQYILF